MARAIHLIRCAAACAWLASHATAVGCGRSWPIEGTELEGDLPFGTESDGPSVPAEDEPQHDVGDEGGDDGDDDGGAGDDGPGDDGAVDDGAGDDGAGDDGAGTDGGGDDGGAGDDGAKDGPICGNGVLERGEACDQDDLGGETCHSLGYLGGPLACDADCNFDTSKCVDEPGTGGGEPPGPPG